MTPQWLSIGAEPGRNTLADYRGFEDLNSPDELYGEAARERFTHRIRSLMDESIQLKKLLGNDVMTWAVSQGVDVAHLNELAVERFRQIKDSKA